MVGAGMSRLRWFRHRRVPTADRVCVCGGKPLCYCLVTAVNKSIHCRDRFHEPGELKPGSPLVSKQFRGRGEEGDGTGVEKSARAR